MTDTRTKAQELADSVNAQIQEAREDLAKRMIAKGQTPEEYKIFDNMLDILSGNTLEYRVWASKVPKTN